MGISFLLFYYSTTEINLKMLGKTLEDLETQICPKSYS